MSEPLDVSLRVRMRYEAGDGAARATTDLEKVRTTAERLGTAAAGGERLNQGLRNTSTLAQSVQRDLLRLSTTATRLGSGDVGGRLTTGLKDAGQAAGGATREITQLGQAAARFGAVSTVSYLARDLKAVHAPAQAAKRDIKELHDALRAMREAADKIGSGSGLRELEVDLQKALRRADDLERRLAGVHRRAGGGGRGGHGEHMEFANEALRASGLGVGGLRFGMGGAAAGGLAAGGAVAATGGALALATGQAISFEHAMTEVKKAVNDTPEGLRSLERDILGFSRATGLAKNDIAALVAQAGYLNVPRDQLKGFAEIASKAAIGFQMRPEEAGEALGHLRAAYGLKDNAQLRSAGDAINTIGDNVGTRERDVLNYLNRTSGVAGMLRIPLAKNAAIGGAVMSLGVAPDVAATGFDSLSGRLANANLEGKDFQRGLRAIHLSGRRAKAMMQEDATGGLIEVLERLKDLPEAKRINAIRDIAGEGNVAAVSRMVESLDKLKEALALVADPSKYAGSLEKTFKIFSSDTQAQIKRAEAAMESWAAKIGSKFSPAVSAAAAAVERWFNAMSKAMDRQEQAESIARRMAKGGVPTPEEQARIDADPRLKKSVDERLFYQRRADEIEAGRKRLIDPPAEGGPLPPSMGEARDAFRRKAEEFERRRRGETLPGTGKRSDLQEGVKASLASYHEEVDESLTRTERLVREFGRRMREDLNIRPKVQDAAFRFGGGDGARIERASIGGELLGGGGGGAGPGRFGGALSGSSAGGARFGGGRAGGGSGLTGPRVGTPGGGSAGPNLSEGAKARAMQYYAGLRAGGLDAVHANALMGHAMQETGGTFKGDSWNAKESAGGMLQYRGNRLANLKRFAAEQGKDWTDPYVQGQFASAEQRMDPYEAKRARSFMNATDVDTASREAGRNVVRFGDDTGPYRERMARAFQDGSAYENLQGPAKAAGGLDQGPRGNERMGLGGSAARRGLDGVDPRLTSIVREASRYLPEGYSAKIISGLRPGDRRFHGQGKAEDIAIYDRSGRQLGNYQDPETFRTYEQFAQAAKKVQTERHPELNRAFRWGGYFGGPRGKSGAMDTMHFDLGGERVGMGGGSFEGGLSEQQKRLFPGAQSTGMGDIAAFRLPDAPRQERLAAGSPEDERRVREDAYRSPANPFRRAPTAVREASARSPRFMDPASYSLKPGAGGADGAAGGGARFGLGGPKVEQHFHGGFDAHEVGRRAQLEQNREVRRTMAGALHDVGHPVSV